MPAQQRNAELVELLTADFLRRESMRNWTPVVTQGGVVACTIRLADYLPLGAIALVYCRLEVTGAGAGGNAIVVSGIPSVIEIAEDDADACVGFGRIRDAGTAFYSGTASPQSGTSVALISDGLANYIGVTPNFALAAGDRISLTLTYERA